MAINYHPKDPGVAPMVAGWNITPSDSEDLNYVTRALSVGLTGAVRVTFCDGMTVTIPSLRSGELHELRVCRVHLTGTTATGIVGYY